ncbi:autotransporter outer membrane beta-barrel domain-containing protein [Sedimentitalea todarodis]|uniref:Autotransporter outer membrane beta-barrel domain-containing protein n=1 Tax=Sedimentitalea todarodis TaxID=1631240 RepID=A0ABU3VL83_9RHOB|nr:autotransporter outer membrane beta-barrel domain-containing protein [Sedimentitalea todarodis]MDU9006949.1 autotransporter outer membrane beta-barrel domain-containing protein [Sedimentitalea todarodis]
MINTPRGTFNFYGLGAYTRAGDGSTGDSDSPATGDARSDPGGSGGNAGAATNTFLSGVINLSTTERDTFVGLIEAQSIGGDGANSNQAQAFSLGDAYGGLGGGGGDGGDVSATMNSGTVTFQADGNRDNVDYGLHAGSFGGNSGAGGKARTIADGSTYGGQGGTGGSAGTATVVMNSGSLTFGSPNGYAIAAESVGGQGGLGATAESDVDGDAAAGAAGSGGVAGDASAILGDGGGRLTIVTQGRSDAVRVHSQGGTGGVGGYGDSKGSGDAVGGIGGDGAAGGAASLTLGLASITMRDAGTGDFGIGTAVSVESLGGQGGHGGEGKAADGGGNATGGDGGTGADAGAVTVRMENSDSGPATIATESRSETQHALVLQSIAGRGGDGGDADAPTVGNATGGNGGSGGSAGAISADLWADISTRGEQSQAVFARSYGGSGGNGGNAEAAVGSGTGGAGAGSGPGGDVTLTFKGSVTTANQEANGFLVQSVGGFSGDGGDASGLGAYGAGSESAGDGGTVSVTLESGTTVATSQEKSFVVQVQSVGGGGGRGGSGEGILALGGSGSAAGDGKDVTVLLDQGVTISASGNYSRAIEAMSIGGGGGSGGGSLGVVAVGGQGGNGGSAGHVQITSDSTVSTSGSEVSGGIFAQSVGGGGGSAHSEFGGIAAIGGSGGNGGAGGAVTINNSGAVTTAGSDSDAVFAQSVGGGGGNGSTAIAGSPGFSLSIGGSGGAAQDANNVIYKDTGVAKRTISTTGDRSRGVFLQSLGGGGGSGGSAIAIDSIAPASVALAFGGVGGAGGDGYSAIYEKEANAIGADISTAGSHAAAIQVQSIGGGGGHGGTAISGTAVSAVAVNTTLGGSGGDAGSSVSGSSVQSNGRLSTQGDHSAGILLQSIGGGGGNSGATVAGSLASGANLSTAIGGMGGGGGDSNNVTVFGGGEITTVGNDSTGIKIQSVGGGGGHGGTTVAASGITTVSADTAVGGAGGLGGVAGRVLLNWTGEISTQGENSAAIMAQSVGGGGGSSGTTVAGALNSQFSAQQAVGGSGGSGGSAQTVTVNSAGTVTTAGQIATGILAHSVGGGGGHSGITLAGTLVTQAAANTAVGGSGGGGGDGAEVDVAAASITTTGDSSLGVSAMSIGGGGGAAHFTGAFGGEATYVNVNTAVGGGGGTAGDGGAVNVNLTGAVATSGNNATGVLGMSVGGGGGNSGTTVSAQLEGDAPIGISVGGQGGASGSGGAVTINTADGSTITTKGHMSEGLKATSVARSGGSAGHVVTATGLSLGSASLAIGGDGGGGGNAAEVTVSSLSEIKTSGHYSSGIAASSIGGGGGSASGSISGQGLSMGAVSGVIGGFGGAGGKGGEVNVTSQRNITTEQFHSYGVLAQSIGGAGGSGGYAAQGSGTAGELSGQASMSVGGDGGRGGRSAAVVVEVAQGTIATNDFASYGVLAQSIGGKGGSGGNVYSGNMSFSSDASAQVNIDIGGSGAMGAKASDATVNNFGAIITKGFYANGILAQSIGGSGGSGGSVYSVKVAANEGSSADIGVHIGGTGGAGQRAGNVGVYNGSLANITTTKGGSSAIEAMSIGGGGGKGGSAANLYLEPAPESSSESSSLSASIDVGIGGMGGAAGNGGTVTVYNAGQLNTEGASSMGISAGSVGGGGGSGGTTSSASFSFEGICSALTSGGTVACKAPDDENVTTVSVSLTAEIGGSGGTAGNGGPVNVTNDGSINTRDDLAYGIEVYSIGGGGGNGAMGALGTEAWVNNETLNNIGDAPGNLSFVPDFGSVSMGIGGSAGATGDGGAITAGGTGSIVTAGDHAFGIHAQSVGGGGGKGGAGVTGLWSQLTVGGGGSGGGKGGTVSIDQRGSIITSGDGSMGIFAQSIGGGGGAAGDVEKGFSDSWLDLNVGAGTGVQMSAGGGGEGGDVAVTAAAITTTGDRAHGILVQSVGGSGGIAQITETASGSSITTFVGGGLDAGDGGDVTITTNGVISTAGERANGVNAQSVGGSGESDTAGDVNININADIKVTGENSRAILAQSDGMGAGANGAIAISIAKAATVSTAAEGWETIGLFDGRNNTISNAGVLRQENQEVGSYVIRTNGVGKLTVTNSGTLEGRVKSETSSSSPGAPIVIENTATGFLGLGSEMALGTEGSVHNGGTMYAGSRYTETKDSIDDSLVIGSLTQAVTGTMLTDFSASNNSADLIVVDSATQPSLAGSVLPNPIGVAPRSGTSGSALIFASETSDIDNTLTVANTAAVDYSLTKKRYAGGEGIHLSYNVNYAPWTGDAQARSKVSPSALAKINENHTGFANHINDLITLRRRELSDGEEEGRLSFVDDLGNYFLRVEDVDDLISVYDRFVPTEIFTPTETAVFSSLRFSDNLMSCPETASDGVAVFRREGSCFWGRIGGVASHRDAGQPSDYDENVFAMSAGFQREFSTDWFAGFAVGYEKASTSSDTVNGDGHRFNIGAVIKREIGATTLSASLSAGMSDFDLERQVITPNGAMLAKGSPKSTWVAAHARVAHSFDIGPTTYLKPWADLGVQRLWQDGYSESGAGDYGLNVGSIDSTLYTLNLMLELGTSFQLGGMHTEATISGGGLFLAGDTDPSTSVSLVGVGLDGPSYIVAADNQTKFANINAKFKTQINKQTTLSADFGALISRDQNNYGGSLKLSFVF